MVCGLQRFNIINTRPIALHPRGSKLSLMDVNQRKADNIVRFRPDFEQFYQKEIVSNLKQPNSKSVTVLKRRFRST